MKSNCFHWLAKLSILVNSYSSWQEIQKEKMNKYTLFCAHTKLLHLSRATQCWLFFLFFLTVLEYDCNLHISQGFREERAQQILLELWIVKSSILASGVHKLHMNLKKNVKFNCYRRWEAGNYQYQLIKK